MREYATLVDRAMSLVGHATQTQDPNASHQLAMESIACSLAYLAAEMRHNVEKDEEREEKYREKDGLCYQHADDIEFPGECIVPDCDNKGRRYS